MMYNPQLETFLRVADAGSFNKAAEESFITPTAVIKQINLLEASLDVQLFERTHRGIVLTKAGKSLYQDAKYVIQYSKEAVIRAQNAMQEEYGCHPDRNVSYDAGAVSHAAVAEDSGELSGDEVSDRTL